MAQLALLGLCLGTVVIEAQGPELESLDIAKVALGGLGGVGAAPGHAEGPWAVGAV